MNLDGLWKTSASEPVERGGWFQRSPSGVACR